MSGQKMWIRGWREIENIVGWVRFGKSWVRKMFFEKYKVGFVRGWGVG